ncbi:NAD(P)/FAD-dependent oxidoreductase [Pseudoxanthomonas putridarboris]|uniref:Protein CbrA n=1 Tax=Pseudoxanthomonas putridarboris TaxID=752605 RepID=A0ABU9J744_9GAMM
MTSDTNDKPAYDAIVVGSSFGGAACALAARESGLRVCVLERKQDPGERLHTTGIIVKEAAENTGLKDLPAQFVRRVEKVRLYSPDLRSISLSAPGYYFLTTDTPQVMRWLADRQRAAGVELRLGQSFRTAERVTGGWHVEGVGTARYLVGADGAKSRVAERFGLGRVHEFLYGVEHEFDGIALPEPNALHCFISRRYAPGYIGWIAQTPTGVQAGLALRHDPAAPRLPDIAGFLEHVGGAVGLPARRRPDAVRAGLIPCGGPVAPLARDGVILTGDAAGIVSPVTAGGIHSAWRHGWSVGRALAGASAGGPAPERIAHREAPRFLIKRTLRWAFDHGQMDWPFDLLLRSPPLRWAAEQVYFHKRGGAGRSKA